MNGYITHSMNKTQLAIAQETFANANFPADYTEEEKRHLFFEVIVPCMKEMLVVPADFNEYKNPDHTPYDANNPVTASNFCDYYGVQA